MNIRQLKEKYPQYAAIPDQELADKLHAKYYSQLPKDEYYKKIGFTPKTHEELQSEMTGSMVPFEESGALQYPGVREALKAEATIPLGAAFKLGEASPLISKALEGRGAATQIAGRVGDIAAKNAAFGAGYSAVDLDQNADLKHRLLEGMIGGGLLGGAGGLIGEGINALRPSRMFRGNLSPEELKKNLQIIAGTNTGLGDVIGSPFLKKQLENVLPNIPFSGANEALGGVGQQIHNRGEMLLGKLLGENSPENIPEQIHGFLNKAHAEHQTLKNNLYNNANKIADETGLQLNLERFADKATKYSDAIEATNLLKTEPDVARLFKKLQNYKNPTAEVKSSILGANGQPMISEIKYPSLKEANLLKGKLSQLSKTAKQSPDPAQRNLANIFGDLSQSLKADIRGTIDNSGNAALKDAYDIAEKNYSKNYSGFLDKDIYKFIGGNAPPETIINKFIKTSPTQDLTTQVSKLAQRLSEPQKRVLSYGYLASRALDNEGNLNPAKLATAISKLGKNQFKALVPNDNLRKELSNYSKLTKMNQESLSLMHNPKTGQRNLSVLGPAASHLLGGALGAFTGGELGGPSGSAAGALGGLVMPSIGGRMATKVLTDPELRKRLVKAMLEQKGNHPILNSLLGLGQAGIS